MTQTALLHIDGATEGTTQWRAETLQMVNWGGFHGHTVVELAAGSTLLSGASGTGKSTMLDAYIALMMPSDTPFNGASNDATVGRARSSEQRNLLTYLRGKTDTSRVQGSEELRDHVLRGADGGPIWGALAVTFINDHKRRYTVARIYYVKAGASTNSDVTTTFAALDGFLDLSRLEAVAASRFDKRTLRATFPGIQLPSAFWEFEETLHTRLGIGSNGDGRKALRLLARVQAGMHVRTVDGLYKSMVLEEPVTYEKADKALTHFANLEASYEKMLDEAEKARILRRLPELQDELLRAEADALLIDQLGFHQDGDTPFLLWRLNTERALLDAAVLANRHQHARESERLRGASEEEARLGERLDAIAEGKRANGGDAITRIDQQIRDLSHDRGQAYQANLKFQSRTEPLGIPVPETGDAFTTARSAAEAFLREFPDRAQALETALEANAGEQYPVASARADLVKERDSLAGRNGMVPRHLHQARAAMAQAAGLDPTDDLPFVAELMDVLPDEEHWRKAIETTLGGLARVVLVDRQNLERLSASIDAITIRPRINFRAVALHPHTDFRGHPDYVSGKLAFKDSPFSRWVQNRVADQNTDHLCVAGAAGLKNGTEPRVTPSGQTRNGDKGAHGESRDGSIIGFSNERRLAELTTSIDELGEELEGIKEQGRQLREQLRLLRELKQAHQYVADTTWTDIDYAGIDQAISDLAAEKERILATSGILAGLEAEEQQLRPRHRTALSEAVLAGEEIKKLDQQHEILVGRQAVAADAADRIEQAQTVTLTEEQNRYLTTLFAREWDADDLHGFAGNVQHLQRRLAQESANSRKAITDTQKTLTGIFEAFQSKWHDPNLGTTIASLGEYRSLLDRIQSTGLHERKEEWRRNLAEWSSEDLVQLNGAFDTAIEDIEERLEPVNAILRGLPFGGKGHLQINLRQLGNDDVAKFRRTLRTLASGLAAERTDEEVEDRFNRLRKFMTLIRIPEGHTKSSTSQRDKYLDVRQHVVITAACVDGLGREVATYAALGGKSGGETQELVAFIVGAALRYQLGDESRTRPRFAPVFLDEGFVKSDSEFAGRAVRAWQRLGFQLIIGAPLDKVTALEPHMDVILGVSKSASGYAFIHGMQDGAGQ